MWLGVSFAIISECGPLLQPRGALWSQAQFCGGPIIASGRGGGTDETGPPRAGPCGIMPTSAGGGVVTTAGRGAVVVAQPPRTASEASTTESIILFMRYPPDSG